MRRVSNAHLNIIITAEHILSTVKFSYHLYSDRKEETDHINMVGMMGWSSVMEAAYGCHHEHPMQLERHHILGGSSGASVWRKGPWTPDEDKLLSDYVSMHGEGRWSSVAKSSGLNRSGKSCRLRWVNYLRPGLKRGQLTPQEEGIIIELHSLWGNKWSTIARYLPGRTDNEIKNYWRTHFKKKDNTKSSLSKKNQKPDQHRKLVLEDDDDEDEDEWNTTVGVKDDDEFMLCTDQECENTMSYRTAAAATSRALDDQVMYEHYEAATWTYHQVQPEERNVELWSGLWNLDDCSPPS